MAPTKDENLNELTYDQIFHRLWTKAVGEPDYVKEEWHRAEKCLLRSPLAHQLSGADWQKDR